MPKRKKIPAFEDEAQESAFWDTHDVTDYFDMDSAKRVRFENLKKSTKSISIRLPVDMLEALKVKANAMDVSYQSLIKMLIKNGLQSV